MFGEQELFVDQPDLVRERSLLQEVINETREVRLHKRYGVQCGLDRVHGRIEIIVPRAL